jgi:pilus assembly protein CpaE
MFAGSKEYDVNVRVPTNGHSDPLYGLSDSPEILLLHSANGQSELRYLADHGIRDQVPLIVCGPANDMEAMRLGMQAGARDYLPEDIPATDLLSSLARIRDESSRARTGKRGKLIVVANGKGGSGASFIAANLAHSLVVDGAQDTLLMDLDLQFGGLCRYLDIEPKMGIIEALEAVTEMDEISAEAYTREHHSGLKLLAARSKQDRLPRSISIERLESLLNVYLSLFDVVVTDAPSRLDAVSELFFERADQVLIVVQQFLPNVQDASRLVQLLTKEVGVHKDRLAIVVNRYAKNADIEFADIQNALRIKRVYPIPNHFKLAAEAINAGLPVAEVSKSAALTKAFRRLQTTLVQPEAVEESSLLSRALPTFLRR